MRKGLSLLITIVSVAILAAVPFSGCAITGSSEDLIVHATYTVVVTEGDAPAEDRIVSVRYYRRSQGNVGTHIVPTTDVTRTLVTDASGTTSCTQDERIGPTDALVVDIVARSADGITTETTSDTITHSQAKTFASGVDATLGRTYYLNLP